MDKAFLRLFLWLVGFICFGVVIIYSTFYFIEPTPDYKELYEEQERVRELERQFINGSNYGSQITIFNLLNQAVQCPEEGIRIQYENQTFVLYLDGCL